MRLNRKVIAKQLAAASRECFEADGIKTKKLSDQEVIWLYNTLMRKFLGLDR